jgi:TPR repeat protein
MLILYEKTKNEGLLERALNGNCHAQIVLAFKLFFGLGIKTNKKESKKFCLMSCNSDNLIAKGFQLFIGWKREINFSESLQLFLNYQKKEENHKNEDYSYCLNMIAHMNEYNKGIEKGDLQLAKEYYEKATELDNSLAFNNLAYLFNYGKVKKKMKNENILKTEKKRVSKKI